MVNNLEAFDTIYHFDGAYITKCDVVYVTHSCSNYYKLFGAFFESSFGSETYTSLGSYYKEWKKECLYKSHKDAKFAQIRYNIINGRFSNEYRYKNMKFIFELSSLEPEIFL